MSKKKSTYKETTVVLDEETIRELKLIAEIEEGDDFDEEEFDVVSKIALLVTQKIEMLYSLLRDEDSYFGRDVPSKSVVKLMKLFRHGNGNMSITLNEDTDWENIKNLEAAPKMTLLENAEYDPQQKEKYGYTWDDVLEMFIPNELVF